MSNDTKSSVLISGRKNCRTLRLAVAVNPRSRPGRSANTGRLFGAGVAKRDWTLRVVIQVEIFVLFEMLSREGGT